MYQAEAVLGPVPASARADSAARTRPPGSPPGRRAPSHATEDLVWMFERMGCATGIDLNALIPVACDGARLPGGLPGGRVRAALSARADA